MGLRRPKEKSNRPIGLETWEGRRLKMRISSEGHEVWHRVDVVRSITRFYKLS